MHDTSICYGAARTRARGRVVADVNEREALLSYGDVCTTSDWVSAWCSLLLATWTQCSPS